MQATNKVRWRSPGWFVSAAGPTWACVERSEPSSKGGLHGNNPCDVLTVVIFMEIESGCRNVYAGSWVLNRRSSLRYRRKALLTAYHLGVQVTAVLYPLVLVSSRRDET